MAGLVNTISRMNRNRANADILAHQRAKEIANPATFGGSGRTPSDALRNRLGLADNGGGPSTFQPLGPVSTLNGADRSNLGFGNRNRKRPGVGSTLGFNPPPTQAQFRPGSASGLSDFLQNSRVR